MTVKELREKTNPKLSQKEFADHFKIKIRTLQEWEQGRKNPAEHITYMIETILRFEGLIKD